MVGFEVIEKFYKVRKGVWVCVCVWGSGVVGGGREGKRSGNYEFFDDLIKVDGLVNIKGKLLRIENWRGGEEVKVVGRGI